MERVKIATQWNGYDENGEHEYSGWIDGGYSCGHMWTIRDNFKKNCWTLYVYEWNNSVVQDVATVHTEKGDTLELKTERSRVLQVLRQYGIEPELEETPQ